MILDVCAVEDIGKPPVGPNIGDVVRVVEEHAVLQGEIDVNAPGNFTYVGTNGGFAYIFDRANIESR